MFISIFKSRIQYIRRGISSFLVVVFSFYTLMTPVGAQVISVPGPRVSVSPAFQPPVLLGLKIHPENPFLFDFIVDRGSSQLAGEELKTETEKLIKYFLAALTIPDKEVWVNLSPYEKDRIIPDVLSKTIMGQTMLEQDYLLKQVASSLTNPEEKLGQEFWVKVKSRTQGDIGSMNTLNKVWIAPQTAEVLESQGIVLVGEKKLKVMMDEDYIALADKGLRITDNETKLSSPNAPVGDPGQPSSTSLRNPQPEIRYTQVSQQSSEVFRQTILPKIEKEVNEGKNFAQVRQIYNSVILATWYKKALKESLLGQIYTDKSKVAGVETDDKEMKQRIYEQYLAAFKKGVYNLIKEEADTSTGDIVPRKYFSGGVIFSASSALTERKITLSQAERAISASSTVIAQTQLVENNEQSDIESNTQEGNQQGNSSSSSMIAQGFKEIFDLQIKLGGYPVLVLNADMSSIIKEYSTLTPDSKKYLFSLAGKIRMPSYPGRQIKIAELVLWLLKINFFFNYDQPIKIENDSDLERLIEATKLGQQALLESKKQDTAGLTMAVNSRMTIHDSQQLNGSPTVGSVIGAFFKQSDEFIVYQVSKVWKVISNRGDRGYFRNASLQEFSATNVIIHSQAILNSPLQGAVYSPSAAEVIRLRGSRERSGIGVMVIDFPAPAIVLYKIPEVNAETGKPFKNSFEFNNFMKKYGRILRYAKLHLLPRDSIEYIKAQDEFMRLTQIPVARIVLQNPEDFTMSIEEFIKKYEDQIKPLDRSRSEVKGRVQFSAEQKTAIQLVKVVSDLKEEARAQIQALWQIEHLRNFINQSKLHSALDPMDHYEQFEEAMVRVLVQIALSNPSDVINTANGLNQANHRAVDIFPAKERKPGEMLFRLDEIDQSRLEILVNIIIDGILAQDIVSDEQLWQLADRNVLKFGLPEEVFGSQYLRSRDLNAQIRGELIKKIGKMPEGYKPEYSLSKSWDRARDLLANAMFVAQIKKSDYPKQLTVILPPKAKQVHEKILKAAQAISSSSSVTGQGTEGVDQNKSTSASSAVSPVGGIDFDPSNMNLQVKRDGKGVPLPVPQQNLEQINIEGLYPVIINMMPVNAQTLPVLLGKT